MGRRAIAVAAMGMIGLWAGATACAEPAATGWLHWRGPQQNGTSMEKALPEQWELGGAGDLWTLDLKGRGTPVIAQTPDGERVYAWGYRGERDALQEVLACLDPATGEILWEKRFNDFLSDIIYDRYSIGAPTVDAETGHVYLMTTAGELCCFTAKGEQVWRISMMEQFGRMTFPNGRTGAPAIDGDLVIVNTISTNWGAQGPPRNRFYAFDKKTGDPVWASTPGVGPPFLKDSSFASPVFDYDQAGRRVFYSGIGSGAVVCVNAKTGEPIWRFQMSVGGINSTPVVFGDKVIAIHGTENLDSSKIGRMVGIDRTAEPQKADAGAPTLGKDAEAWRIDGLAMFTSSPVLVGDQVYQVNATGELYCIDAATGKVHWEKKLGLSQIHASPLYGDGKLYVPMNEGLFYILKPGDDGAEVLSKVELEGNCLGSPAVWNGRVYVFTTEKLYCFGKKNGNDAANLPKRTMTAKPPKPGPIAELKIVPDEVLLRPGERASFRVHAIDGRGYAVGPVEQVTWNKFIPPTAKVKAEMDAQFDADGSLVAAPGAEQSAGAFKATAISLPGPPAETDKPVTGTFRGRVMMKLPYKEDFESFTPDEDHAEDGVKFAYPPLPWIGARFKWDIREIDGSLAMAKTLDRLILQRAITFIGDPELRNYTFSADVMTDGNRRLLSEVGLINQRYIVVLKGNHSELEVNSNHERLKVATPFSVKAGTWYRLKTRVDVNDDGSGVVRAKAWERQAQEPTDWTIEVPVQHAHPQGSPGLFGFAPQNKFSVYIDNLEITPND